MGKLKHGPDPEAPSSRQKCQSLPRSAASRESGREPLESNELDAIFPEPGGGLARKSL